MRRITDIAISSAASIVSIALACVFATPAAAQTRGQSGRATRPSDERVVISINGIYQTGTDAVAGTSSFTANAEPATVSWNFPVKAGPGFDGSARINLAGPLGVMLGGTYFTASGNADVTAKIPHPFFFNQPRTITGTAPLKRDETTVRLALTLSSRGNSKLQFSAYGGAAFFSVKQDLVDTVTYTDSYPYDTAAYGTASIKSSSKSKVGFAAGADVSYFFSKSVGIGATAAIAKATISATTSDGTSFNFKAGGTQVGAGIRFRF